MHISWVSVIYLIEALGLPPAKIINDHEYDIPKVFHELCPKQSVK